MISIGNLYALLSTRLGFVTGCQMMWLDDWSTESLVSEGRTLLEKQWPAAGKLGPSSTAAGAAVSDGASTIAATEGASPTPRAAAPDSAHAQLLESASIAQAALSAAAEMHAAMLREQCQQLEFVGEVADEVLLNEVRVADKKKDILKTVQLRLPNMPYSKSLLLEHIRYANDNANAMLSLDSLMHILLYCTVCVRCTTRTSPSALSNVGSRLAATRRQWPASSRSRFSSGRRRSARSSPLSRTCSPPNGTS